MKVLSIISYYRPHWTGMTSHAARVAEALVSRGHEFSVLTTRHSPELPGKEKLNGVEIVRLRPLFRFSRGMIAPSFPLVARKLVSESDVVQIHTPLPEAWLVSMMCRAARRPLIMTHHGDVVMPPGAWNRCIEKAALRVLSLTADRAAIITSYSDDYVKHSSLLSQFVDRVVSIPPPVTMPKPDPERTAAWREQLGLQDKPVVGFAGRWVREKGLDYLLQAMPRVRERVAGAHLVFAGERNVVYEREFDRCKGLVRSQGSDITLLDLISDPQQLANFYAMCDVIALPSRTDMFALVQVEAMLCGTPVVATDIPGARVVLQTVEFGRLVAPNDPAALASGLVDVLLDPARYRPNHDTVHTSFDAEASYQAYERLLAAAVESKIHA